MWGSAFDGNSVYLEAADQHGGAAPLKWSRDRSQIQTYFENILNCITIHTFIYRNCKAVFTLQHISIFYLKKTFFLQNRISPLEIWPQIKQTSKQWAQWLENSVAFSDTRGTAKNCPKIGVLILVYISVMNWKNLHRIPRLKWKIRNTSKISRSKMPY